MLTQLEPAIKQYLLVSANYWIFTLSDGALRMLIVLHFHTLGYSPLDIALLFLFYEFFGVVTNLLGGWLAARVGLNHTMNLGLSLQITALAMLLVPTEQLTVVWVMLAQALSGIAKDLNKMSAKSTIKLLLKADAEQSLFRWTAFLTGSKNSLKGGGFFLGGLLLWWIGFHGAVLAMLLTLSVTLMLSLFKLRGDLGRTTYKPKFKELLSKSRNINLLSAARFFLFAARDIWFVVALPVYLSTQLGWSHTHVGSFLALWIVGYGIVQTLAPWITGNKKARGPKQSQAFIGSISLLVPLILIGVLVPMSDSPAEILIPGLLLFGVLFAVNSSIHSYLILSLANRDAVSLDVGFYYMANAAGRLVGTLLSGWLYQAYGLTMCIAASAFFVLICTVITSQLEIDGFANRN